MNTLFMRIFLFFSCLLLAAGAVLGLTMYNSSSRLVEQSMGMQAQAVAERAAELIDTAQYAPLSTGQNETDYYDALRGQLNQLREANGLKYLYTLGQREENGSTAYYYVVDGAAPDVDEDDFSPYGSKKITTRVCFKLLRRTFPYTATSPTINTGQPLQRMCQL